MTLQLIKRLRLRQRLLVVESQGQETKLRLRTGQLAVVPAGIVAKMQPPFSKLTGHFPWPFVPGGFAALRVLTEPDACESVRAVEMALGIAESPRGRPRSRDVIALEDSDMWLNDANTIVHWGASIAQLCPLASVARDLRRVPTMSPAELDKFVHVQMRMLS